MASTEAQVSMATASGSGAGTTIDFTSAKRNVSAVIVPSASLSSGTLLIEASQDGANWVTMRVIDLSERTNYAAHFTGVAFRYWRGNLARSAAGGTVRVTFMEADS